MHLQLAVYVLHCGSPSFSHNLPAIEAKTFGRRKFSCLVHLLFLICYSEMCWSAPKYVSRFPKIMIGNMRACILQALMIRNNSQGG